MFQGIKSVFSKSSFNERKEVIKEKYAGTDDAEIEKNSGINYIEDIIKSKSTSMEDDVNFINDYNRVYSKEYKATIENSRKESEENLRDFYDKVESVLLDSFKNSVSSIEKLNLELSELDNNTDTEFQEIPSINYTSAQKEELKKLKEAKEIFGFDSATGDPVIMNEIKEIDNRNREIAEKNKTDKEKFEARKIEFKNKKSFLNEKIFNENNKIKIIEFYKEHYGNYKFMFEEDYQDILSSHNLKEGIVKFYAGNIPTKNFNEMKRFKESKILENVNSYTNDGFEFKGSVQVNDFNNYLIPNEATKAAVLSKYGIKLKDVYLVKNKELFKPENKNRKSILESNDGRVYAIDILLYENYNINNVNVEFNSKNSTPREVYHKIIKMNSNVFHIAATENNFIKGVNIERIGNFILENDKPDKQIETKPKNNLVFEYPIVSCPVKHGRLIITKFNSDEEIL